ncbi:MAG: DUF5652 family protein [Candidatus Magasanikbacteria bacterium]
MQNVELYQTISLVITFILMILWSLVWKGLALWRAAKNDSKPWFVILLIFNTLGIFEIFYIYVIGKEKKTDVEKNINSELPKTM